MNLNLFIFWEFSGDYEIQNDELVVFYTTIDAVNIKMEHLRKRYNLRTRAIGSNLYINIKDIKSLPDMFGKVGACSDVE